MPALTHVVIPIVIAAALPFLTTLSAKLGKLTPRDNLGTRVWQQNLDGWRQRATWAHQNAFETFPMFAAAVILAHLGAPGSQTAMIAAYAYPSFRVLYTLAFIANKGAIRSSLWFASMIAVGALFVIAVRG